MAGGDSQQQPKQNKKQQWPLEVEMSQPCFTTPQQIGQKVGQHCNYRGASTQQREYHCSEGNMGQLTCLQLTTSFETAAAKNIGLTTGTEECLQTINAEKFWKIIERFWCPHKFTVHLVVASQDDGHSPQQWRRIQDLSYHHWCQAGLNASPNTFLYGLPSFDHGCFQRLQRGAGN